MSEGRTKKAVVNITFNLSNQIVNLILAFISRSVFIWGLGVSYLGINGLFSDVLGLLSLADLGFNTAMVYSFYKPLAEKDYHKMAGLTTFYRKVYIIISILVTCVGICIIPLLPYIINLKEDIPNLNVYYLLSLANIVFSYLCVYKTSILTADQKAYKMTTVTMIINIIKTIIQIIAIVIWKDYVIYLVIGCISVLAINIVSSHIASRDYPFINEKVQLNLEEKRDIFKNIGSVFVYKMSTVLVSTTDNILISIIIGTVAVGYYSNYLLIQNKISLLYVLIFSSITASVGNLIVRENPQKRFEIFKCEQSLSFIVCGICTPCFILLVNDFIEIWLGEMFILSNTVVIAIGLNMYLSCVLQPLWSYREATGIYRKTKWVMLICAILNLILSFILGEIIGLAGIIFATSIAKLLTYVWYEPKILFKQYFGEKPRIYYIQIFFNMILTSSIVAVGAYIKSYFVVNSWSEWIIEAVIIGIACSFIVIIIYIKSEGVKLLVQKAKLFIKK